jgi:hypothetical protein
MIFMAEQSPSKYNLNMNTMYCTYCSKQKSTDEGEIPAIQRYLSQRIAQVNLRATIDGCPFFILSGKYGIIPSDYPLPYYDHRLSVDEVEAMASRVGGQLQAFGVKEIHYFSNDPNLDSTLQPYASVIEKSCRMAGIKLTVEYFPAKLED